jgi:hypothetical protein
MYPVLQFLIVLAGGAANTLRGRAILPRWAFYLVMAALALLASGDWRYALLWGAGSALWLAAPWGEGFAAINGIVDPNNLGKNPFIEKICFKLVPDPYASSDAGKRWGFFFMAQRGLYYLYPTFILWFIITGASYLLVLGLFSALQGACYRMFGFVPAGDYSVACAEVLMGCVLGLLIVLGVTH